MPGWMTVLLLVAFSCVREAEGGPPGDGPTEAARQAARAAGLASEANRNAFRFGTVRFTLSTGTAPGLRDALDGRWTTRSEGKGFFAYDGKRGRYECVHTLKEMVATREKIAENSWNTPITSERDLTDGTDTLFDVIAPNRDGTAFNHTSQITPGTKTFFNAVHLPMDLFRPGPQLYLAHDLDETPARKGHALDLLSVVEPAGREGAGVLELTFGRKPGGLGPAAGAGRERRESHYRLDRDHGSVLVEDGDRVPSSDGEMQRWKIQDDLRRVGELGWVPYRRLEYNSETKLVREWRIVEANFKKPPEASVFQLGFEVPVQVRDQVKMADYQAAPVFDMADRPPVARLIGRPKPTNRGDEAKKPPPTSPSS